MVSPERISDLQIPSQDDTPRLLVSWQSRSSIFWSNFRDLILPRRTPRMVVSSAPGIFWKDVFVNRSITLRFIVDSYALHVLAVLAVYFVFTSPLFQNQPLPQRDPFAHTTIEYYSVSEYLPPIRSAPKPATRDLKGQPAFAKQEIISVPPDPDNLRQTVVTPDMKILAKDVPLPNVVAWADRPEPIQPLSATRRNPNPKLLTPPDIIAPPPEDLPRSRREPRFEQSVVQPPPEKLPAS